MHLKTKTRSYKKLKPVRNQIDNPRRELKHVLIYVAEGIKSYSERIK